jgi:hypothetical protein
MSDQLPRPTPEQVERARWDLLLLDIEHRTEQIRQIKTFEGWRLLFSELTAVAAILGVGIAIGHFVIGH